MRTDRSMLRALQSRDRGGEVVKVELKRGRGRGGGDEVVCEYIGHGGRQVDKYLHIERARRMAPGEGVMPPM